MTEPARPSSRILTIALVLATLLFAPFAVSAFLFVRLPPAASTLTELGWPRDAAGSVVQVLVEPEGRTAWIVATSAIDGRNVSACHVDLTSGRAIACHRIATMPVAQTPDVFYAYGAGRLLLLVSAPRSSVQLALLTRDVSPVFAEVPGPWGDGFQRGRMLTNAAWNVSDARFEIYASQVEMDPRMRPALERVSVTTSGVLGAWERIAFGNALPPGSESGPALAGLPGLPPGAVLAGTLGIAIVRGDSVRALAVLPCRFSWRSCLAVASASTIASARFTQRTAWLDDLGQLTPLPLETGGGDGAWVIAQALTRDGGAVPVLGRAVRESGRNGLEFELRPRDRVTVRVVSRGGESVLSARTSDGRERLLARDAEAHEWQPIPWSGGVLLVQPRRGALALDSQLGPLHSGSRWRSLQAIIAHRFHLDAGSTVVYLLLLLSFPLLFALGARALRRSRTGAMVPRGLVGALITFAVMAALILSLNSGNIFPPA